MVYCKKVLFLSAIISLLVSHGLMALSNKDSLFTSFSIEYIEAGKEETSLVSLPLHSERITSNGKITIYKNEVYQLIVQQIDRGGFTEIMGELEYTGKENAALTVRISLPQKGDSWKWYRGLERSEVMTGSTIFYDTVSVATVHPPDGAFNGNTLRDGGYGDPVGRGSMSFYPLAALNIDNKGKALGIDLSIPMVYRIGASAVKGLFAEFDIATSPLSEKFPNRAFFKLSYFDFDATWGMRAALQKYYTIYPDAFKKRVIDEGIWLPFTPLRSIPGFEDFGIVFHETSWTGMDVKDGQKLPNILSDKGTAALSFQYTEPWDVQLPILDKNLPYNELVSDKMIPLNHRKSIHNSATHDKNGQWQIRRLKTPWFQSGWAMSITTNSDPDLGGENRYHYVLQDEIKPAIKMNVDGIYFDSMEWNWHHDLNYREDHFKYVNYPLTFSKVVGRPAIWNFTSEFALMKKVGDEMHSQGKLVMGNGHGWNPFAAANLDLFGAELSWYYSGDHNTDALDFKRAISFQKPIVFLLNEGLNDTAFTQSPHVGYQVYFEKLMAYGFFPSFFSVDASSDPYWQDKEKIENGRPFFKKYIPIIKLIAAAGWQPVTYAKAKDPLVRVERFGDGENLYFTIRNNGNNSLETEVVFETDQLGLQGIIKANELVSDQDLRISGNKIYISIPALRTQVIRINKN